MPLRVELNLFVCRKYLTIILKILSLSLMCVKFFAKTQFLHIRHDSRLNYEGINVMCDGAYVMFVAAFNVHFYLGWSSLYFFFNSSIRAMTSVDLNSHLSSGMQKYGSDEYCLVVLSIKSGPI